MSLHVLADHMASKGRNGDSMLVHMTPGEVAGLHALAAKHGGSLTINPDTGLPEAGFLSSILPALAGFALNAFAPGLGSAIGGALGGLSAAAGTGIAVGGITALSTGSLSRGLMAGMGAYGGAGLAEGLMGAGGQELAATGTPIAENIASTAGTSVPPIEQVNPSNFNLSNADKLSAGVKGLGTEAGRASVLANLGGTKGALTTAAMAASPIMADAMVPTTTKMPENPNPAYIRQYVTGDRPQAPRALAPVLASQWGARSFSDAYKPMATGGIVALAGGGAVQHYEIGGEVKGALEQAYAANDVAKINELVSANKITAEDVGKTWEGFDTSGIKGLQLYSAPAAPTYTQYTEDQMGSFLSNPANKDIDINQAIKDTNADPAAVNRYIASLTSPFKGSTETTGGSGTLGIYNQMVGIGVDPNEYYKAAIAANPNYAGWSKEDIARGYSLDKGAYALAAAQPKGVSDKDWVNFMDTNKYSVNDMAQAFGLSLKEVRDRYNAVKNAEKKTTVTAVNPYTGIASGAGPTTDTLLPTNPQTNAPPGTSNPYGNVNNPGDLTFNPDGTITVQPNLPGRPYGGYSGIEELTNAYTAGGGSTGYVSPVVKTAIEHDKLYNKQTGDSLEAYNYLIGKGGAKYPTKSRATSIMEPYEEAVLGYPSDITKKKYINVGGKMVKNPDYKDPFAKTTTANDPNNPPTTTPRAGYEWGWNATDKKWEEMPITASMDASSTGGQAAGGLQGYAVGGGLGSLGSYSDGGRLLKGPGDGVSDSIPATIGRKQQPARLADGEFVVPARIVSELGNGSTDAGAKKLYAMMDRVQRARGKTTGKNKVAANSRADKYLPA